MMLTPQTKLIKDKIIAMIKDKVGYGIDLLKACEDYDITISDYYDFLLDSGYTPGTTKSKQKDIPQTDKFKEDEPYYSYGFENKESKESSVDHPSYYKAGGIEAIDVIHSWGLGFDLGNAVKYISRAGKKDPSKYIEDLKKACWYIQSEIRRVEKNNEKT